MPAPDFARSDLAMFRYLWALLSARRRAQVVWLVVLSSMMAVSTLGGVAAIVPFFSVLADPSGTERHALLAWLYAEGGFESHESFLVFLGVGFAGMVLLSNAINLAGSMALNRFALVLGRDFHVALYEEYLHRDYPFHLRFGPTTLTSRVVNEAARVVSGMVQGGLSFVAGLLASLAIVVSIVLVEPLLALAAAVLYAGGYAAIYFTLRGRLTRDGKREAEMFDARARTLLESFGGIKEVLLRGAQRPFRDACAAQSDSIARVSLGMLTMAQAPRHLLECLTAVGLVGAALWLNRGTGAATWLAQLSFLGLAAYRLLPAIQQAFVSITRIRAYRSAFQNIADDLRQGLRAERAPPPSPDELRAWQDRPRHSIVLRDVSFRYAPEERCVIRNLSLKIRRGQVVGIVGANGAGKTTLADLILGLLVPESGAIEVDGIALDPQSRLSWRRNLAYVPQHIFLFDASIQENITLAGAHGPVDAARLAAATRAAGLDTLLADLPGGIGFRVGDRGGKLSGGQRQRVGIARALYHRATVLLLDEATSALDGSAESEVVDLLASLRGHYTVIVIAHRATTLAACEVIVALEDGSLADMRTVEVAS